MPHRRSSSTSPACTRGLASAPQTSSPSSTPRTGGSSTRRRCRTWATSSTTSAGTAAAPPATARIARTSSCPGSARRGSTSSTSPTTRAGPSIEKVIEPDELVEKTGYTRPHTVHCMPGDNIVVSMLGDREGGGAGGFAVIDARTFELKGRWENGGARPPLNYDFWYQPRKNVLVSSEFGEPNAYEEGFDIADVEAGPVRTAAALLGSGRATAGPDDRPRRGRAGPARGPMAPRPGRDRGIRRRGPVEQHLPLAPGERLLGSGPGGLGRQRRARRLAATGRRARSDHRPARLDGRPLPVSARTGCTATSGSTTSPTPPSRV